MATDEERLAALKAEEQKTQFHAWLDEWYTAKKAEIAADDPPPKRTKEDGKTGGGLFSGLFGGI
jgi:hypothetical protein